MPKSPAVNVDLINEKIQNIRDDVDDLETTLKKEYTPLSTTNAIDIRVKKFESFWDWSIKIVLGALIVAILAIIGLK
jgi:tetrahydromethanopterin S-methyltransferase subunit B